MRTTTSFARAAAAVALALALTGTALAGGGKPEDPGKSEDAPGQVKQAQQPAQPAAPPAHAAAAENRAEKPAKPAKPKAAKAEKAKPAKAQGKQARTQSRGSSNSKSYKVTSRGTNERKPEQTHRHTICHATGSESNPYVRITPSVSGVHNGHMGHQDGRDIIPPYTYKGTTYSQNWDAAGQAIFASGCRPAPPAPGGAGETTSTTTTTTTDTTGTTTTTTTGTTETVTTTDTVTTTAGVAGASQPPSAGGVLGARATLPEAQPRQEGGGVLGAVGRIGRTATTGTLPFTGLPVWVAALIGLAILGAGVALRRSA